MIFFKFTMLRKFRYSAMQIELVYPHPPAPLPEGEGRLAESFLNTPSPFRRGGQGVRSYTGQVLYPHSISLG